MAVTIHPQSPRDLFQLVRDLELLDGSRNPRRVRRAVHGSGAIVDEDLALAWLQLTQAPSPQLLESLMRQDPNLYDLVGRRAPDAALQELAAYQDELEQLQAFEAQEAQEVAAAAVAPPAAPARKATKNEWEAWAIESGLVQPEQAAEMTKAQLQELAPPAAEAPAETEEG